MVAGSQHLNALPPPTVTKQMEMIKEALCYLLELSNDFFIVINHWISIVNCDKLHYFMFKTLLFCNSLPTIF